jgi:hypothetical protein
MIALRALELKQFGRSDKVEARSANPFLCALSATSEASALKGHLDAITAEPSGLELNARVTRPCQSVGGS